MMRNKEKRKHALHFFGFLTIFILCFCTFTYFLERQTLSGAWNYTVKVKGFYQEEEDSMDVMGFGSSHMYCSFIPNVLFNETNINSYVLATQEQTIEMSYFYLKEALKTQSPKVVILETYMFNLYDVNEFNEGAASNAIENLKWSANKIQMINKIVPSKKKQEFFFPLLKYHDLWKTWEPSDLSKRYRGEKDEHRGYVHLEETKVIPDFNTISDKKDNGFMNEEDVYYLDKFVSLANENDISIILLFSPTKVDQRIIRSQEYIKEYASAHDLLYLNMYETMAEMDINTEYDFYDGGHLNVFGADKLTRYLKSYILDYVE